METAVIAATITATAAVIGPIVTYYVTKRTPSDTLTVEVLKGRAGVYEKAASLLRDARSVYDTTWGSDSVPTTQTEIEAKNKYLTNMTRAKERDNTTYREVFTLTDSEDRRQRYERARQEASTCPSCEIRCLAGLDTDFPLIDFLVVDEEHVILSHLSASGAREGYQHIYVKSSAIAKHLIEYFEICWQMPSRPLHAEAAQNTGLGTDQISSRPPESDATLPAVMRNEARRVFVSHGRSPDWREVQSYIEKDLMLGTLELAQEPSGGLTIIEKLESNSPRCDSAVIVMSGDDTDAVGQVRARENVIHEIGWFQSRYGRGRVVLMHQEDVTIPTNLSGVVYVSYPKQSISAGFYVLARELKAMYIAS
ncbi:TIR domain-containing protein [Paraburkholderia sp. GAS42]|uniref:TIR domain-containing protein n=1 Tax=Paraburkholderia sp. GAS42 TaxID=3035135 RepID=UPI003D1ADD27